jgi:hypothetical protein
MTSGPWAATLRAAAIAAVPAAAATTGPMSWTMLRLSDFGKHVDRYGRHGNLAIDVCLDIGQ